MGDLTKVKEIIQKAVEIYHTHPQKKTIKEYINRFNFACPFCGDSQKKMTKFRGNIRKNSLFFRCYNCGRKMPFTTFCDYLNLDLDPLLKNDIYDHIENNQEIYNSEEDYSILEELDKTVSLKYYQEFLQSDDNNTYPQLINLEPVQKGGLVDKYLDQRKIIKRNDIYQGDWWVTSRYSMPVMVFLNRRDDHLISLQIRNLENNPARRKYHLIPFSHLYTQLYGEGYLEKSEKIIYDKISSYFNILNVSFQEPITLFEGYLDSTFFPNSIGLVGVNTDMNFFLKNDLDIRLFFDNDKDGIKKSQYYLEKFGKPVFLWEKLFEELAKKSKDPYKSKYKLENNIKDLNKLAEKVNDPYHKLKLHQYFSVDELDLAEI